MMKSGIFRPYFPFYITAFFGNEQVGSDHYATELYSEGLRFKSWLEHCLIFTY
jgi:hypothetical protein